MITKFSDPLDSYLIGHDLDHHFIASYTVIGCPLAEHLSMSAGSLNKCF